MKGAYDILKERGFVEQVTDEALIRSFSTRGPLPAISALIPRHQPAYRQPGSIMSLAHMQRNGNKPIALVGGGTGLIGDPSGKTEMRQILTREQIDYNASCWGKQLSNTSIFPMIKPHCSIMPTG